MRYFVKLIRLYDNCRRNAWTGECEHTDKWAIYFWSGKQDSEEVRYSVHDTEQEAIIKCVALNKMLCVEADSYLN